jgi:8-oxo-dGTP diphosphatase
VTATTRRVTRVAAYAVCVEGEELLLSRIAQGATVDSDGMWTLPGGGIEFGEDPRDAALRELTEETGLTGEVVELAGVDSWAGHFADPHDGVPTDFHAVRILYRVRIVGGALRAEVDGSSDDCAWIPRDALGSLPIVELVRTGARLAGLIPTPPV